MREQDKRWVPEGVIVRNFHKSIFVQFSLLKLKHFCRISWIAVFLLQGKTLSNEDSPRTCQNFSLEILLACEWCLSRSFRYVKISWTKMNDYTWTCDLCPGRTLSFLSGVGTVFKLRWVDVGMKSLRAGLERVKLTRSFGGELRRMLYAWIKTFWLFAVRNGEPWNGHCRVSPPFLILFQLDGWVPRFYV